MGKIKELAIEGVTDLHSYHVGFVAGRKSKSDETISMIQKALNNASLDLDRLTPRMAITVLIGAIMLNAEEDEDNADIRADSN